MNTELYAVIKKSSKYAHQQPCDGKTAVPFEVSVSHFGGYCVYGNDNQYRVADLNFFVKTGSQFVRLS